MQKCRVVITGMGIICGGGRNVKEFTGALLSGRNCLSEIDDPSISHFNVRYGGLVGKITNEDIDFYPDLEKCDRFIQLSAIAAREAVVDSRIDMGYYGVRGGLFIGTCSGPALSIEKECRLSGQIGITSKESIFFRQYFSAANVLSELFSVNGPIYTVTTACSAFTVSITAASDLIRSGSVDVVLAGGADVFSRSILAGFAGLHATCTGISAPFSRPAGLNLGEGAGFLVLESYESAISRNANIIGEVLGYGITNDAYHCSAPHPAGKGASLSMKHAFNDAGLTPEDIGYISAHGTGTESNDKAETRAIIKIFGESAGKVPVSSLKSMVGHCLGAAGAVETIASLICACNGVIPQTNNFTVPREGCNLDYVPDSGRKWTGNKVFLKNNFAFGGNNASLIISSGLYKGEHSYGVNDNCTDPICITGLGFITPAGVGIGSLLNLVKSSNGELQNNNFETSSKYTVPEFDIASINRRLDIRSMDKSGKMACAAASLALKHGKYSSSIPENDELGLYMCLAQGSNGAEMEHINALVNNGFRLQKVNNFPFVVPNSLTGVVCRALSITGHNITLCNGPGAGLGGLHLAWTALVNGHASSILCGSVDNLEEKALIECCASFPDESRPKLGEGAAMILLEKSSVAARRGVMPLGKVVHVSSVYNNGSRLSNVLKALVENAILISEIKTENIGLICCSKRNKDEISAVRSVFSSTDSVFDISDYIGYAPACFPLFSIGAALADSFCKDMSRKYIITLFSSPYGNCGITIIEKYFEG
jgi:3-oxoacyl-[acyl-carrier-protein] synthase II